MKPLLRPLMPELNSLRGLACLAVLFYHGVWAYAPRSTLGYLTSGGHLGVNLFFVLSGLLITNILLESRDRPDYFKQFYKRRILRILPAYYMMLILLAIHGVDLHFIGLSLLHIANMAPALNVKLGYPPLWSLAVEEQFYMLFPLLVRKLKLRALIVFLLVVFLASVLLPNLDPKMTFALWHNTQGLALGALLTIFLRSEYGTRKNAAWLGAGLASVGMVFTVWEMIFAGLLLGTLLVGSSRFAAWVQPKTLLFFGDISYGLYLVHILVFSLYRRVVYVGWDFKSILIQFLVCSIVSILLATLSRFTVEEWFLRLKEGVRHHKSDAERRLNEKSNRSAHPVTAV